MKTLQVLAPLSVEYTDTNRTNVKKTVCHEPGEKLTVELLDNLPLPSFRYFWVREGHKWLAVLPQGAASLVAVL